MILKTYARVLTNDLDASLKALREIVGGDLAFKAAFGRFEIGLIGDFCIVAGSEDALGRFLGTVGPVIIDDLDAALATVSELGAELTMAPFEGPIGRGFLARHADGVEYEYMRLRPDVSRLVLKTGR
jgi:hypothetical protein